MKAEITRAEFDALVAEVARLQHPRVALVEDAVLLAAIADAVKGRAFSARELHQHAQVVGGPLLELLTTVGATSARRLGKRLQRIAGRPLGGVLLTKVGTDRDGAVWLTASVS